MIISQGCSHSYYTHDIFAPNQDWTTISATVAIESLPMQGSKKSIFHLLLERQGSNKCEVEQRTR
jgi:hypothetical protein